MIKLLIIGAGGFVGSVLRYLLSGMVQLLFNSATFPCGTFAVNLVGSLIIGFFMYLSEAYGLLSDSARAFLIVGLLGGFTTFSAFANETFNMLRDGESWLSFLNVFGQVFLCLASVWLGRAAAHLIWR